MTPLAETSATERELAAATDANSVRAQCPSSDNGRSSSGRVGSATAGEGVPGSPADSSVGKKTRAARAGTGEKHKVGEQYDLYLSILNQTSCRAVQ
jgi:hypothetical protein